MKALLHRQSLKKYRHLIVAVLFIMQRGNKMDFYNNKDKTIICPNCHKFLTKADSKDTRTHKLTCGHCGKWIWYVPNDEDSFQIKEAPNNRTTSSGKTFY